jgi:hypothetical protein
MTEKRRDFLRIVLGTGLLVAGYGMVNDQWVAAIAPQHFFMFHPAYFPLAEPWEQALCFGLLAGVFGMAWGILLYGAGRVGPGPALKPRPTLQGVLVVIMVTGTIAWSLGSYAAMTGHFPYPRYLCPSDNLGIFVTQTVQLTNDLVGFAGALLSLVLIVIYRWSTPESPTSTD